MRKVLAKVKDHRVGDPVRSVKRIHDQGSSGTSRNPPKVRVTTASGASATYDYVILATHGDEALRLLDDPTEEERRMLQRIRFNENRAVLHSDVKLMPHLRKTWSSWNVMVESGKEESETTNQVCLYGVCHCVRAVR